MHEKKTHEGKKRELFESLAEAERSLVRRDDRNSFEDHVVDFQNRNRNGGRDDPELRRKYGRNESIFKRPDMPIGRCLNPRRIPDYHRNPQRWTRYTLDDVSDTSDRMNTTAAFNFLRQIEEQKQKQNDEDEAGSSKIVFKKSVKLKPRQEPDELDPQLDLKKAQGNKIVMPEYVVGEKRQSRRPTRSDLPKSRPESTKTSRQLQLSHLNEDEDDED